MKKFVLNIMLFTVFTCVFYTVTLFVWGTASIPSILKPNLNYRIGSTGHLFTRLVEVKKIKDVDVLFLGSSHAYRGFDTRIFSEIGLKTFNLGSSGQTPIQTNVLCQRYLDELNPKLVIFEVYPETFNLDGVESSLDLIANDVNDHNSVKMALRINNIKTYNTLLYGIIRDYLNLNRDFHESLKKNGDTYINGGYVEKELYDVDKLKPFEKKEIVLNEDQVVSFEENLLFFKRRNIKVVLVYAPIPTANYERYTNTAYYDSVMRNYSEYYNFNELIQLNDSLHFLDSDHLNQCGVDLFNRKLIEVLNLNEK